MAYIQLNDGMLAMLYSLRGVRHAKTLEVMLGREPEEEDVKDLFKIWLADLVRIAPGARQEHSDIGPPLHYELTDQGKEKLDKIDEGESTDRYEEGIEKMREDNQDAEVLIVEDPGQSKRSVAVVKRGGVVDYEASRYVYSTGVLRKPRATDIDAILEEAS